MMTGDVTPSKVPWRSVWDHESFLLLSPPGPHGKWRRVRISSRSTKATSLSNAVVLVSTSPALTFTASQAVLEVSGGQAVAADLSSVATVAAELRPYALIIPRDVYEFGAPEFDALAKDLDTGLIIVPDGVQLAVLSALLSEEAVRLG